MKVPENKVPSTLHSSIMFLSEFLVAPRFPGLRGLREVLVTEVSRPMVASLQEKGFPVLSAPDLLGLEAGRFWDLTLDPTYFPRFAGG